MRSSGAPARRGKGASFWEVRGTFDLMKMLALQVKCYEAQPHTHTHTWVAAVVVDVAARKWKMLAPGATKKSYEWSRHIFFYTLSPTLPSWAYISVCSLWPESRLKCIQTTLLFSVLVSVSVSFSVSLFAHYNKMFPRKFSYLLSY